MEKSVDTSSYEDFVKQLPANDGRYAIFDFDYELGELGQQNELVFFFWCVIPWRRALSPVSVFQLFCHYSSRNLEVLRRF